MLRTLNGCSSMRQDCVCVFCETSFQRTQTAIIILYNIPPLNLYVSPYCVHHMWIHMLNVLFLGFFHLKLYHIVNNWGLHTSFPSLFISAMCLISVLRFLILCLFNMSVDIWFVLCKTWIRIYWSCACKSTCFEATTVLTSKLQMCDRSPRLENASHPMSPSFKSVCLSFKEGNCEPIQVAFLQSFLLNPNTSMFKWLWSLARWLKTHKKPCSWGGEGTLHFCSGINLLCSRVS